LAEDYESFRDSVNNLLEKIHGLKIIITSKVAMSDSVYIHEWVYKIRGLSRKETLRLIKEISPPNIEQMSEFKELMKDTGEEIITHHPLFNILKGHPLSIIILSSLRNEMSLKEIYDLLRLIERNNEKHSSQAETLP
jgi:hypothetical protein